MTIKKYAGDKVVGLSTDIKPNNVPYGGTFYEVDTGKIYTKDSGNTWTYMSNTQFSNISVGGTATISNITSNVVIVQGQTIEQKSFVTAYIFGGI